MAQELVLRSNSSFLRKDSTCVVTRRTLVGQHDRDDRPALVAGAAPVAEAHQGEVRSRSSSRGWTAKKTSGPPRCYLGMLLVAQTAPLSLKVYPPSGLL